MVTKKTPSATSGAKPKPKTSTTRKPKTTAAKAKTTPPKQQVLPPSPKPKKPTPPAKPEVIDAKVVSETKKPASAQVEKPATKVEDPAKTPSPADPEKGKPEPTGTPPTKTEPAARPARPMLVIAGFALGSLAAGIIGYAIALKTLPPPQNSNAETIAQLNAIDSRVSDLETRLTAAETQKPTVDLTAIRSELDALAGTVAADTSALGARLDKAEQTLSTALENAQNGLSPATGNGAPDVSASASDLLASYGAEIKTLKAQLAAQVAKGEALAQKINEVASTTDQQISAANEKVQTLAENAKTGAKQIDLAVARTRLRAAVEGGKTFAAELQDISALKDVIVPEILNQSAAKGVASMTSLRSTFPQAARKALKASLKPTADASFSERVWAFLKNQIGARSLDEKAGDDPDAILSRAEAELGRDNLPKAIALVLTLPEAGIAAMNDWLTAANMRVNVETALADFTQHLDDQ